MAISEVTTVTVDGITIGLSDVIGTLITNGDFTVENLTPYMFCGQLNYVTPKFSSLTGAEKSYTGSSGSAPLYFPNVNTGALGGVTVEFAINDNPTFTNDLYGRNVLLYDTGRVESIHNDSTGMTARVVTSIDFKKIYYDVDAANNPITTGRPAETISCYVSGATGAVKTIDNNVDTLIKVYSIVETDSTWYCILDNMFPASNTNGYSHICSSWQYMQGNYDNTYESLNYCLDSFDKTKSMFKYAVSSEYAVYGGEGENWNNSFTSYIDITEDVYSYMDYYALNYSANFHCYIKTLNGALEQLARAGLKFKWNNIWYKPVGEGGYITGYTDDMTEMSDWDDISDVTGNTVPVTPPGPTPPTPGDDDDNTDPINYAGAPYAQGLVNYYAMTAGSVLIEHIADALSTWDLQNTGKDLFKNLVSCKLIKPPAPIPTSGSAPFTIYGEKPQYQGADITLPVVNGNPVNTFGPYSISRKFNDFRDYAPYTRVSIFLPYCGWCDLPSHVVGRSVTVKYFTDVIAATVRAIVSCNDNIIAEAAGVMGLDIPFTADAVGMKQAGVVSGLTAYAGGALQTAAGVAQLVTSKDAKGLGNVFSGGSKLLSAYAQTAEAFNENTTEISGKNGDGCSLSGATNIIIKIIRPKYGASSDPPYVPAGFAHAVGFVSNKQVRVGNVSGLLIADNVDTSGIAGATDAERAEIKRVLETGLIVNDAPE